MIRTAIRTTISGIVAAVTVLLLILALLLPEIFFSVYSDFSMAIQGILAGITAIVPFPIWEPLLVFLLFWLVYTLIRAIKRAAIIRWASGVLVSVCILAAFFLISWGFNYFAPPMQERLELPEKQYTTAQLKEAAIYYRDMANKLSSSVSRNADGTVKEYDLSELSDRAGEGYEKLAESMDCFGGSTVRVKTLISSPLVGATGTTGIFMAFTGESSISSTTYTVSQPFTMCHELGHRMAFAREDEANFAAYLACEAHPDADFRYSGYYNAFRYCYNALAEADSAAAKQVWSGVSANLAKDCNAAVSHYASVQNESATAVTEQVYDTYLKTFAVDSGVQSYGEVTDLLLCWYFERIK